MTREARLLGAGAIACATALGIGSIAVFIAVVVALAGIELVFRAVVFILGRDSCRPVLLPDTVGT